MKITKAIIPAAGLGTRFLPYTKSVPKELLPIMETPAIQFIIEEGLHSGIAKFTLIANENKHAIIDYFSPNRQLEEFLKKTDKISLLESINTIIEQTTFKYVPQSEPLGLGHAILMAKNEIGNNYFGILLPDEIMMSDVPVLQQLISHAQKYNCSVIAVQEVPRENVSSYGIIAIKHEIEDNLFEIDQMIEKPAIQDAPSRFAIIGRYVLSPTIFSSLEKINPGAHNEIQLTDGITHMMQQGEKVLAYKVDTIRHDIGNPIGWLQANIHHALTDNNRALIIKDHIKRHIS